MGLTLDQCNGTIPVNICSPGLIAVLSPITNRVILRHPIPTIQGRECNGRDEHEETPTMQDSMVDETSMENVAKHTASLSPSFFSGLERHQSKAPLSLPANNSTSNAQRRLQRPIVRLRSPRASPTRHKGEARTKRLQWNLRPSMLWIEPVATTVASSCTTKPRTSRAAVFTSIRKPTLASRRD